MADDKIIYIDANGLAHSTAQECVDANLGIESANGQYVTGGNCGQDSANIPTNNSSSNNSSNTNSTGK